ncbi:hypothetical protein GHT06_022796 [Daphnia sinensis]|uniref:Uncharacterized protein n=1 Tax=Daphnia sinensis TaxID=1820382 RepID=A0AAD5KXS8_9CRUS|nr:hypothetical protein GHT06_022796 [Daphnia sinensis]
MTDATFAKTTSSSPWIVTCRDVSDNLQLQQQKAVFDHFQTLPDTSARGYTLWKELENTIPKGVFRRLRLPEPFPEQRSARAERKRIAPYTRPVPETLGAVPLLSTEERSQLDALTRVRASQAARIAEAQKAAQEAEKRAKLILEASRIRKEKERLRLREEALARASKPDIPQPEPQPGPSTSPRRPTILERINREIREQTVPKPIPVEDTPEVAAAKAEFAIKYAEAKAAATPAALVRAKRQILSYGAAPFAYNYPGYSYGAAPFAYNFAAPTVLAAPAVPVRDATLTKTILTPGHAVAYRVDLSHSEPRYVKNIELFYFLNSRFFLLNIQRKIKKKI